MSNPADKNVSIKNWSLDDRPREKLLEHGGAALSDVELLAILIGSGTPDVSAVDLCRKVYAAAEHSLDSLGKCSIKDLMVHKGIGPAKAVTIAAAMELGRRRAMEAPIKQPVISCSNDVFRILQPIIGELNHEEFWMLTLNNSNKVLGRHQLSKGGITATLVDVRLLYRKALETGCVAIILAHNHPSGKLKPSQSDFSLTKKIINAGKTIDIKTLDHIIITQASYYSFADNAVL